MYAIYTNTTNVKYATSYLIYFPDLSGHTPKKLQKLFENWLFDKTIDHAYWVYRDGRKYGVSYDIDVFIKWLNENVFTDCDDKVKVVEKNLATFPPELPILYY